MQTQEIPVYSHPSHQPCPDLPYHSLSSEQKAQGLKFLQRTRQELKERQLKPLRAEVNELKKRGSETDDRTEQKVISLEIARIQKKAEQIQHRWG